MNNVLSFINKKTIVLTLCLLSFNACGQKNAISFPNPKVEAGVAKISGRLVNFHSQDSSNLSIVIQLPNIITADGKVYKVNLKKDSSFYLEAPVESDVVIAFMVVSIGNRSNYIEVSLSTHKETEVEISLDKSGRIKVNMQGYAMLSGDEMIHYSNAYMNVYSYPPKPPRYTTDNNELINDVMEDLEERIKFINNDSILSAANKGYLANHLKMGMLEQCLLSYNELVQRRYINTHPKEEYDKFIAPPGPGRSYYKLLQHFDLNSPQYLLTAETYPAVLHKLLSIDSLGISPIGDTPIATWLSGVKSTMADLVGFNEGQFYDMLAASSYTRQFDMETKPLSKEQVQNINEYFNGDKVGYAEVLLRKNTEIQQLAAGLEPLTVNETITTPNSEVLNTIVAKHKGKVVVVDLWATWCGPCLQAMKKMKEIKSKLKGKDVAYVYLTNSSSPKKLWLDRIKGIGSEHYYLTDDQWEYIMTQLEFTGIPSYLIYDTNGKFSEKFSGYPGTEYFKEAIVKLLPN